MVLFAQFPAYAFVATAWQAVSGSNFNPRNTICMSAVKIIAFLEIEQNLPIYELQTIFRHPFLKMN